MFRNQQLVPQRLILHAVPIDVLVPRLRPRNTLPPRLLPREIVALGRSLPVQCVPGLEPWNENWQPHFRPRGVWHATDIHNIDKRDAYPHDTEPVSVSVLSFAPQRWASTIQPAHPEL